MNKISDLTMHFLILRIALNKKELNINLINEEINQIEINFDLYSKTHQSKWVIFLKESIEIIKNYIKSGEIENALEWIQLIHNIPEAITDSSILNKDWLYESGLKIHLESMDKYNYGVLINLLNKTIGESDAKLNEVLRNLKRDN